MTLSYTITPEDLLCWYRYAYRCLPSAARQRKRYLTVWITISFALAAVVCLYYKTVPVAIIAFAVAAIASYRLSPWYERQVDRALKNQIADPQIQGIFGAYQLTLSDEGVRDVGQTGESFCKWSGVAEVVTHGDYIFIRVVSGVAFVISRRSYSGAVPFEELPQVIEEFRKKYAAGN